MMIDAGSKSRYDKKASGQPDGRGPVLRRRVEESPHSKEHGAGETPGRGNLPEKGHRNRQLPQGGDGEKAV
jgi:hypothetical protein